MDLGRQASESQDSDDVLTPPGISASEMQQLPKMGPSQMPKPSPKISAKGVENAKKRLRAFSIQKKGPLPAVAAAKAVSTGNTTVLIGKLSSVKVTPKPPPVEDEMKPPKPPKPGSNKRMSQEYADLQKRTLDEIETMKRKMELVELGIPLGLISPHVADKAMPTKAMPPIKTFLDSAKVDEIIREAKIAKAEGREFKFDYTKYVPDYDNPFQRKRDDMPSSQSAVKEEDARPSEKDIYLREKEKGDSRSSVVRDDRPGFSKSDKTGIGKDDRDRYKEDKSKYNDRDKYRDDRRYRDREKDRDSRDKLSRDRDKGDRYRERSDRSSGRERDRDTTKDDKSKKEDRSTEEKEMKETAVDLNDFVVCDSWSLDNDTNSPQVDDKNKKTVTPQQKDSKSLEKDPLELLRKSLGQKEGISTESPKIEKFEKLKPVIDSFKYEIDPCEEEEEAMDMLREDLDTPKFAADNKNPMKETYDSPLGKKMSFRDKEDMNDDTFLESVINEIKEGKDLDDECHGLVEYDSPAKEIIAGSVTPELNKATVVQNERSDYSEGYRSTESRKSDYSEGYKSTDSRKSDYSEGYKSTDSRKSDYSEGYKSTDSRKSDYAEGYKSTDSRKYDHSEGYKSTDSRKSDYSEGSISIASTKSGYSDGYRSTESRKSDYSEGYTSTESRKSDYSEGYKSTDSRKSDYADNFKSIESRKSDFVEGYKSNESRKSDFAENCKSNESRKSDYVEGYKTTDSRSSTYSETYKTDSRKSEYAESRSTDIRKSDYSEGYKSNDGRKSADSRKSTDISKKSTESEYNKSDKSSISVDKYGRSSIEKEIDRDLGSKMSQATANSLDTWSFVMKICQPLLFRHDKNKCYSETRSAPKLWFAQNPKLCSCVKDRSVVYEELEMCKMNLVNSLYGSEQSPDLPYPPVRGWYPPLTSCLAETVVLPQISEWEIDDTTSKLDQRPSASHTPDKNEEILLDLEYRKFMEAVWPEIADTEENAGATTPESHQQENTVKNIEEEEKKAKKIKAASDNWSQESEVEEPVEKSKKKMDKEKIKEKRKRKHSSSHSDADSEDDAKRKKKSPKKKASKKTKLKSAKRRRTEKKLMKKLKTKKKKRQKIEEISPIEDESEKETKKKDKKVKKKKHQKLKKKAEKRKRLKSSTSDSTSSSSSDTEDDRRKKKERAKKKKNKKKKRKQSTSESTHSEELFDVNVLNNIKTERLTDDERQTTDYSGRHREIINVKELHEEFSTNVQIKQEKIEKEKKTERKKEEEKPQIPEPTQESQTNSINSDSIQSETSIKPVETGSNQSKEELPQVAAREERREEKTREEEEKTSEEEEKSPVPTVEVEIMNRFDLNDSQDSQYREEKRETQFKEPEPPRQDDISQCSSQESIKEAYEKDESHLRPTSQNSNYSFRDVIAHESSDNKFDGYENYEMYEQMAMEYQSDVASQISCQDAGVSACGAARQIETLVRARSVGEIKCDWRAGGGGDGGAAGQGGAHRAQRPSRWGLKPGEVNIVLTGGEGETVQPPPPPPPAAPAPPAPSADRVYRIQNLANRTDSNIGYDEAYMDMYGASDRLQYGDCFADQPDQPEPTDQTEPEQTERTERRKRRSDPRQTTLDDRINRVLRDTALSEAAKETEADKDGPEKGILVTAAAGRCGKRVRFADGYTPGQDSDTEQPPNKKRKKPRRVGCAWPCPPQHPDHVPLWDALPPPPPPPGSPPPPARAAPPVALLRSYPPHPHPHHVILPPPPLHVHKYEGVSLPPFMPPEPPPGLISFT